MRCTYTQNIYLTVCDPTIYYNILIHGIQHVSNASCYFTWRRIIVFSVLADCTVTCNQNCPSDDLCLNLVYCQKKQKKSRYIIYIRLFRTSRNIIFRVICTVKYTKKYTSYKRDTEE